MKIVKYYKNGCAPCNSVAQYLESKNISAESVNIYDDPDAAFDKGIMSVPVTILEDDNGLEVKRVIGFNALALHELIELSKQG